MAIADVALSYDLTDGVLDVLDGVNLHVGSGEIVAVVGPSGCGKSSLIHAIAGFVRPTRGTISVDGIPVGDPSPDRGVVLQNLGLFPWRTVRGNIEFGLRLTSANVNLADRVGELLSAVKLEGFANLYPSQLSGGMAQRVALARTLAPDPRLLLLDEPFGALDAQTRLEMQSLLAELQQRRGMTVLLVTHDVDEALFLADRVLVMSARPATILEAVAFDLPRPRSHASLTDEMFVGAKRQVLDFLRTEVLGATVQSRTALLRRSRPRFVTVGHVPAIESLPLQVVAHELSDAGAIGVELIEHESGPALLSLIERGILDLALVGACPVLSRIHGGSALRVIRDGGFVEGSAMDVGVVVAPPLRDAPLDSIVLEPIGINGVGTNSEILTRAAFSPTGRQPTFMVKPAPQLLGELKAGRLKAAALFAPHCRQALDDGALLKIRFTELVDPLQISLLVARQDKMDVKLREFLSTWDHVVEGLNRWSAQTDHSWPNLNRGLSELGISRADIRGFGSFDVTPSLDRAARLDATLCQAHQEWSRLSQDDLRRFGFA